MIRDRSTMSFHQQAKAPIIFKHFMRATAIRAQVCTIHTQRLIILSTTLCSPRKSPL